jgi:putative N6-adenine-specific DNA methylase/tRNA (guanine6-N2)-methyltransferase
VNNNLLLTTNPGLEECAFAELAEAAAAAGWGDDELIRGEAGLPGRVAVASARPEADLTGLARRLRSVHHLHRPVQQFRLDGDDPLADIEARCAALDLPSLGPATPFRITSERIGSHDFTSHDVQRAAGAGVAARTGAPVDLTGFRVELCVDVHHDTVAVTQRLTRRPLSHRAHWHFRPRVALRANLAFCMLRWAGLGPHSRALADPFCGSGTVLAEAGLWLPRLALYGADSSPRSLEWGRANLAAAGLSERARLWEGNAREAAGFLPGRLDAIVTNPPYGQQLGRRMNFPAFYADFLAQARDLLAPGGRLVMLATRRDAMNHALRRTPGLERVTVQKVETGGLYPSLYVLERD